jgi:hypothetical protein
VESRKLLPVLLLVVVLLMTAIIGFFPATGDFRVDNPFWNGISQFNEEFEALPLDSFELLPSDPKGTVLIVVPYLEFADSELEVLRNYVSLGGTLVVLDDFGYGNQILGHLGLTTRFSGDYLLDPLFNYKNSRFPKITNFANAQAGVNVSSVVLNHASFLSDVVGVEAVAYSSKFSFVDLSCNGVWDEGEPQGAFPVAGVVSIGEGVVVAIADPSLLINSMISMEDNFLFLKNVVGFGGSDAVIFVDQSHLPRTALDDAKLVVAGVYGFVASPLGTLSLIVVVFALCLKPIWRMRGNLGSK